MPQNCDLNSNKKKITIYLFSFFLFFKFVRLQFIPFHLRELDLAEKELPDSALNLLLDFLLNPRCKLEILRLFYNLYTLIHLQKVKTSDYGQYVSLVL